VTGPGAETPLADVIASLRRSMRRAARAGDVGSLSVAQLELLSCVAEHPRSRPGQVARLLNLAPNSVATLVTGLAERGMLTRSGGDDRRTVTLALTPAGTAAVRGWQATNTAILRTALLSLHPAWQQLLLAAVPALRELVRAIEAIPPPPEQDQDAGG
jgi:DNA-binding MarR family transcriptional regulator